MPTAFAAAMIRGDQAVLVPYATYSAAGVSTAVGVATRAGGTLHWAFFDISGARRAGGAKALAADQRLPFIWANEAAAVGGGLADVPGYLLFALDTDANATIDSNDAAQLTANAFLIDLPRQDVAFIPTVPVDAASLADSNPANWATDPIRGLSRRYTAQSGSQVGMSYLIDGRPDNGDDTHLYVYTTASSGPALRMGIYNGEGVSRMISAPSPATHLNVIDLETSSNLLPVFYGDGSLYWNVPFGPNGIVIQTFVFSLVESTTFGATQTLLADFP